MAIHTVYVGAHVFDAATARRLADESVAFFREVFPTAERMADLLGLDSRLDGGLVRDVHVRVGARLASEQIGDVIEDLRIDFEDGYAGTDWRADARRCADAVAKAHAAEELPAGFGLRIHSMAEPTMARALETLDVFVGGLADAGAMPAGLAVTLAKIDSPDEVSRLADALDEREPAWGLDAGSVPVELMAETPRSVYDAEGRLAAPALVEAARGRCVGVHFGVYDYTASLGLVAGQQRLRHPACDFARGALQVALAQTGVELSDGSSRVVPRLDATDRDLATAVRGVYDDVRRGLDRGIYRGWDMAASHVVVRRLAVTAFFLEQLPEMKRRRASVSSRDLEDAATRSALETFFRRGLACGALLGSDVARDSSTRQ